MPQNKPKVKVTKETSPAPTATPPINKAYQDSLRITQAQSAAEAYQAVKNICLQGSFTAVLITSDNGTLQIQWAIDPENPEFAPNIPEKLNLTADQLLETTGTSVTAHSLKDLTDLPNPLLKIFKNLKMHSLAFVPAIIQNDLMCLLILGTHEEMRPETESIKSLAYLIELLARTTERLNKQSNAERSLREFQAITSVSRAISEARNLNALYAELHQHVRQFVGEMNFLIAIYEPSTNSIQIPYLFGEEEVTSIESFPLGEGLTSILLRTREPLMIVEDTERRAQALGAKVIGKSAKSWLGAPFLVGGEAIGAIIIQDPDHEHAFDESDLKFVITLASQVAGAIHNTRLLEETQKRALQLQTASEIARDISGLLELSELLSKAVTLIRERFNFYHAAIFMVENEFAVIREATGDAGMQMKRAGHRLAVGSKSIVGYVSGTGESLVVNDTTRDATYYANPLLPETRAEVAIPLKIGQRILGVLDVQSTQPFAFKTEDVNVLRILADQLAVAVINSELFAETQEHLSQHRLLHHVMTAAASGTTLEEALQGAAQGLQVTLGGDHVAILLASKDKKLLEVKASVGFPDEIFGMQIPFNQGITGWAATHLQAARVDDVTKDSRYIQVAGNIRSELAVPLVYRGELLGVLNVESDHHAAYSETDEEMLGTLGGSLAAIISNARLLEQIRRQSERERAVYDITGRIRRSTDMRSILSTTANELEKATGARRVHVRVDIQNKEDN